MKKFNVINFNFNNRRFESYDVIPYLVHQYRETTMKPKTFDEFKKFIKDEALYRWWSRCEYEIILVDWPCKTTEEKWDVYKQVEMNLDVVTELVMKSING